MEVAYTLTEMARMLGLDRRRLERLSVNIKPVAVCLNGRKLFRIEQFDEIRSILPKGRATRTVR